MTDHTDPRITDGGEREIDALRAELRDAGLLPDLPRAYEPTAASADAMLARVLASQVPVVEEPLPAVADDTADEAADEVAGTVRKLSDARRRRTTLTQTLFGLAATVLVAAVIVVPAVTQSGGGEADSAGAMPESAADESAEGIVPMGEGLIATSAPAIPSLRDAGPEPTALPPLVGTVVDIDGCLAVQDDATGTIYVPVETATSGPIRADLVPGARVSLAYAENADLQEDTNVPAPCDPAGPFWPTASLTVLP